jgi:hypothetical protein
MIPWNLQWLRSLLFNCRYTGHLVECQIFGHYPFFHNLLFKYVNHFIKSAVNQLIKNIYALYLVLKHYFILQTKTHSFLKHNHKWILYHVSRWITSGFCCNVYKICTLLGYYRAWSGNYVLTFWYNLSVKSSTSVEKYKKKEGRLPIPKDHRSYINWPDRLLLRTQIIHLIPGHCRYLSSLMTRNRHFRIKVSGTYTSNLSRVFLSIQRKVIYIVFKFSNFCYLQDRF